MNVRESFSRALERGTLGATDEGGRAVGLLISAFLHNEIAHSAIAAAITVSVSFNGDSHFYLVCVENQF